MSSSINPSNAAIRLKVLGARATRGTFRAHGCSRLIFAVDAETLKPLQVRWQYEGDAAWKVGASWRDDQPHRPLAAETDVDLVRLNPANIIGNGASQSSEVSGAFVALRGDRSLVAWGTDGFGASIPEPMPTDVAEVSATQSAHAARTPEGNLTVWGNVQEGGSLGGLPTTGYAQVIGNLNAFAAMTLGGQLKAWGNPLVGGNVPAPISDYLDIKSIHSSGRAFAAIRKTGHVVAWGSPSWGGALPGEIAELTDIVQITGTSGAFAALRANGSERRLVSWGHEGFGGLMPEELGSLTDIDELACANTGAFAALQNGNVWVWGDPDSGGEQGSLPEMRGVVSICASEYTFVALQADGHVVGWGGSASAIPIPTDIAALDDIVQLAATRNAFAALRRTGQVVRWDASGGNVLPFNNAQAIYAGAASFTALTAQGRGEELGPT